MNTSIPDELDSTQSKALAPDQQQQYLRQLSDWRIVNHEGVDQLQCVFRFRNFAEAMDFSNEIARLAEQADHHPSLTTEWGRVTVSWWTHRVHGLHINDFVMASRSQQAYARLHSAD